MKTMQELFEAVEVKPKNPGILEVPDGKGVMDLPLSHFEDLVNKKGLSAISKALVNLERWNKEKNPKLSSWAKDIEKKISAKMDK